MARTVLYISYNAITEPLVQTQVLNYLERLDGHGYRFVLMTFERDGQPDQPTRTRMEAAGIQWRPLPYRGRFGPPGTAMDLWAGSRLARRLCREHDIGLIHARSLVPALIARRCKRALGTPYLFDIRGFWIDEKVYKNRLSASSPVYRLGKRLERAAYRDCDALVSLTETALETLRVEGTWETPPPMRMIPTCTNLDAFAPRQTMGSAKAPRFIYVGSLGAGYMPEATFALFKHAKDRWPNATLRVVSGTDPVRIAAAANAAGVASGDYTTARVPQSQIPTELANADIGICFIQPHYAKLASCPTKLGEYLAAGLAVIGNHGVGDMDKILADSRYGMLIDDFSNSAMNRAVRRIDSYRIFAGQAIKARQALAADYFSLDRGVQTYAQMYDATQARQER